MAVESAHPVDPGAIAGAGITSLVENTVVSNLVTREGLDQWRGRPGMSVETTVPGVLPYREYEWHNDRSEPIKTDDYSETVVSTKIGFKRPYSAVRWSDENEFDFRGDFGRVFNAQIDAVGAAVEDYTLDAILKAPFEVAVRVDNSDAAIKAQAEKGRDVYHNAFVDVVSAIDKMRVPYSQLNAVCSNSFADDLEKHNKLVLNQGRGDGALGRKYMGDVNGISFYRASWVPDGLAFVFDKSAFVLRTATPRIPRSVPFGAAVTRNGYSLSWLMDYSSGYLEDRSVFHTYAGASQTLDLGAQYAPWLTAQKDEKFFTRGVVIGLGDAVNPKLPGDGNGSTPGSDPNSVLAQVFNGTLRRPGLAEDEGLAWPDYMARPAAGGGSEPAPEEPGDVEGQTLKAATASTRKTSAKG